MHMEKWVMFQVWYPLQSGLYMCSFSSAVSLSGQSPPRGTSILFPLTILPLNNTLRSRELKK